MTEGIEITLEQLLDSREARAARQKKLVEIFEAPIVSFTVNMPGACKRMPMSCRVFETGFAALLEKLSEGKRKIVFKETYLLDTGYEALLAVKLDERILKECMLEIEDAHPMGRLFDFDVIGLDGCNISREMMGYPKRKCLLCEDEAHACGRSRKHSIDALMEKIKAIAKAYY